MTTDPISDQTAPCASCGVWRPVANNLVERELSEPFSAPVVEGVALTPDQWLKWLVEEATAALDTAHAAGYIIPPQAAAGIAVLDTTAQMLAAQSSRHAAPTRDHSVTGDPVT